MTEPTDKLLVKYHGNWADEMDVKGFHITKREHWDEIVENLRVEIENEGEVMYYIGTNEEIVYETIEDVLQDHTVIEITDEEYNTIERLFGRTYGFTGPDL